MATAKASLSHEERTAQEPREPQIEPVTISRIDPVNSSIRLLRLSALDSNHVLKFLPGQWLDVFIPTLPKAGGFTITSIPEHQGTPTPSRPAYYELAVQKSSNPPAKWLSQPESDILGQQIFVRAGGSFVWPPPGLEVEELEQVVLVAGGVGVNPLVSILERLMGLKDRPRRVRFVYASKVEAGAIDTARILFLNRIVELVKKGGSEVELHLFLTGTTQDDVDKAVGLPKSVKVGRIGKEDLEAAVGSDRGVRGKTVCYVCGPPVMTDQFVEFLSSRDGMDPKKVLCEKWW